METSEGLNYSHIVAFERVPVHPERHFSGEAPHVLKCFLQPDTVIYPAVFKSEVWLYVEDMEEDGQGHFNGEVVCTTLANYIPRCGYSKFRNCLKDKLDEAGLYQISLNPIYWSPSCKCQCIDIPPPSQKNQSMVRVSDDLEPSFDGESDSIIGFLLE